MRALLLAGALATSAACGGAERSAPDGGAPIDGAAGDGAPAGDAAPSCEPESPAAPALPTLTPCPMGWTERPGEDPESPARCEPWPTGAPVRCDATDEAHFPGEPGCARLGSECPADGWPAALPADRPIVYVDASADAATGTGRRDRPYAHVADAAFRAREGAVVAIRAGVYDEHVELDRPLELRGACARDTVLTLSAPRTPSQSTLLAYTTGAVLRDLTVRGGAAAAVVVSPAGTMPETAPSLHLEGVVVEDTPGDGLRAEHGAAMTGHRVVVRRTGSDARLTSAAVLARVGGSITLDVASIEQASTVGLFATDAGTRISCTTCAIRDTLDGGVDGTLADGALAASGAVVTLAGAVLEGNTTGVRASNDGRVQLVDGVIRHGVPTMGVSWAAMVFGELELARVRIEGATQIAISTSTPAHLVASDLIIEDTRGASEDVPGNDGNVVTLAGDVGIGIVVEAGTTAELRRTLVTRSRAAGIFLRGDLEGSGLPPGALSAEDVVVRDTLGTDRDGSFGRGVQLQAGSRMTFARMAVERSVELGVGVYDATLEGTDLIVRDVVESRCDACDRVGIGLGVYYESSATIARYAVSDASLVGAHLALGGVGDLSDGLVERSVVGISIGTPMFDATRALECVVFHDVEDEHQTREIAVPPPLTTL